MKHKYINNIAVNEYIHRKNRLRRDRQAFEWQLIQVTVEEREAYLELLNCAEHLLTEIESVLTTEQKKFVDTFFFKNISSLQEIAEELNMGKTTIHRYRSQIVPVIEKKWLEYKWWFDTYMPIDENE